MQGGQHSWLYEFPEYRSTVAAFLSRALGGPYAPEEAAARAVGRRRPSPARHAASADRGRARAGRVPVAGRAASARSASALQPADDPGAVDEVVVMPPAPARGREAARQVASGRL